MTDTLVATPREVRAFLLEQNDLPEGVVVGQRGRLSRAAKDEYRNRTGREIAEPVTASAE